MILTLARMDQLANAGNSPWHRACALSKMLLALLLVLSAVFAPSLRLLLALLALVAVMALAARLPARLLLLAGAYPLLFAALFVLGRWDGTFETPLKILIRPVVSSLAVVWLMGTTPYPDVFAPLSHVVPRGVGDGLFLTYRALFELLGRLERLWRALQLRGGTSGSPRRRLSLAGEGLGTLVLYGFERSQRFYATMRLRGHSGRICGCRHYADWTRWDLLVGVAAAVAIASLIAFWRSA